MTAEPSAGHRRLNVFVGTWNVVGQQHEGPVGPAAKIAAVETFEWLAGGFFLVHRFEGTVGEGQAACIEIIGHDPEKQNYPTQTFYNNGLANDWSSVLEDDTWILTGDWQMDGTSMMVRCTTSFNETGRTRTSKWEQSRDGSVWQTFWEVKAKKTGDGS